MSPGRCATTNIGGWVPACAGTTAEEALPDCKILFQSAPNNTATTKNGERPMKLGAAIAEIMKREGIEILCGYPVNHLIEFAANADIRPIMVRQERIGVHQ